MFGGNFQIMKKTLSTLIFSVAISFSQGDMYPTETQYGGGIGFGTMFMVLDRVPGQSVLNELGFNEKELGVQPLVFFGGEGFSQMSGPWRLGGYAGVGTAQMTNVYEIIKYKEDNAEVFFQPDGGDVQQDYFNNFKVKARINFLLGALMLEYVVPIYRDLEVSVGALAGLGRYSLSIDQQIKTNMWKDIGKNPNTEFLDDKAYYAYLKDETVYVAEHNAKETYKDFRERYDSDNFVNPVTNLRYREMNLNGAMSEIGGSFFNFQPYIAVKWQFLDRTGLRMSAGFNQGSIGSGRMNLNNHIPIGDSPKSSLMGFTIRTMIYFGL